MFCSSHAIQLRYCLSKTHLICFCCSTIQHPFMLICLCCCCRPPHCMHPSIAIAWPVVSEQQEREKISSSSKSTTQPMIALSEKRPWPHTPIHEAPDRGCRNAQETERQVKTYLLRAGGVLGDGLGAFGDGVLGQLTGEDESH
jgi:hypothetical protein